MCCVKVSSSMQLITKQPAYLGESTLGILNWDHTLASCLPCESWHVNMHGVCPLAASPPASLCTPFQLLQRFLLSFEVSPGTPKDFTEAT